MTGQTLQGATSVTISGATARVISRGQYRLVVRVALAAKASTGVHVAVVRFAQGPALRFYVDVVRHGSALVVRTSTNPSGAQR